MHPRRSVRRERTGKQGELGVVDRVAEVRRNVATLRALIPRSLTSHSPSRAPACPDPSPLRMHRRREITGVIRRNFGGSADSESPVTLRRPLAGELPFRLLPVPNMVDLSSHVNENDREVDPSGRKNPKTTGWQRSRNLGLGWVRLNCFLRREPVRRLLPEGGGHDELPSRLYGGNRHHHPIERHQDCGKY